MAKSLKTFGSLPMPLRVAGLTFLGVVIIAVVGLFSVSGQKDIYEAVVPFGFGVGGLAAFFLGTILATDYRGSASAYARLWDVGAWSLLRVFVRVSGAGFMIAGALFVALFVVVVFVRQS